MRRGTIFVVLFVVIALGVIAASQFLRSQPPLEVTIAVSPLAEGWLRDAVNAFNATNPLVNTTRIQIKLTLIEDMKVWSEDRPWTTADHPAAWIPASSASVGYAGDNGLPFQLVTPSLARTPLVWGGFTSRLAVLDVPASGLDWAQVVAAADAESWANLGGSSDWQFVKLAFARPSGQISGLAVLFSGAATYHQSASLDNAMLRDTAFREWLAPVIASVPNFNTLGADPAAAMGRGPSTAEIAFLPEVQWLNNLNGLLTNTDSFAFSYPAYQFMLDFPLARWDDNGTTAEQRAAVDALRNWLTTESQQQRTVAFGLRPAASEPDGGATLFSAAIPYGIQYQPDYGQLIQAPQRGDAQGLIQWFNTQ
ncbi:MAG: substrate-binding domain-containing protein [Anaerolineaceae bacterium]|nr:substrate-binding domain-containing protein [Anaerolineaceae bacterium]